MTDDHTPGNQTIATHASDRVNDTNAVAPPIWQTSTFSADDAESFSEIARTDRPGEFYTRYGTPNNLQVEETIAQLEGAESALVSGSGMGSIFAAVMATVSSGDHVVSQSSLYAGTATLLREHLPRFGVDVTIVDATEEGAIEEAVNERTRLIYVETPSNPLMRLVDLAEVARVGRTRGILTMCDNTFATPINQRPIELGIDLVAHSATKFLGGHHDLIAGALVGRRALLDKIWKFAIVAGASLGPFDSWLLLRGLRTLGLRVERHNANALAIARALDGHPSVERVYYPGLETHPQHELARRQMRGFGGILSVELRGGYEAAERLIASMRLAHRAASLGGYGTLVVHPAAMWGQQLSAADRAAMGIGDGLVRIAVGLEDEADLLRDIESAIEAPIAAGE